MTAQILAFPDRKTCYRCLHFDQWGDGVAYCQLFDRDIETVTVARDCNGFEAVG